VLLRGAGQGISRGVKHLRDLGARLLQRTRFKGFRIRIQARRFRLEGKINPWVLLATGEVKYTKQRGLGDAGAKIKGGIDGQDAFVLGQKSNSRALAEALQGNQDAASKLFAVLDDFGDEAARSAQVLKALRTVDPNDVDDLCRRLHELKFRDEEALLKVIDEYRANVGIQRGRGTSGQVEGGTVAAGKGEFDRPGLEGPFTGGSKNARPEGVEPNPRFESARSDEPRYSGHAEQTVLGDIGGKLDNVYRGVPKDQIKGTVKLTVEQQVCNVCRQGNPPGIFLKFSNEYPNVRILVTAQDTSEILIIQGGRVLTSL
jgi:hypothetical protein